MNDQPGKDPFDEAVRRAGDAETNFVGVLRAFGHQLRSIASEGKPAEWAELVDADGLLCQMEIGPEEAAQFGNNLVPYDRCGSADSGTMPRCF